MHQLANRSTSDEMKCMIVLVAIVAVASAQFGKRPSSVFPQQPRQVAKAAARIVAAPVVRATSGDADAQILRYDNDASPDGAFSYSVETSNGIAQQAQGTPRDFGGNPPVVPVVIQGSYGYTSADGVPVSISYTADENGYQATGDAIPTPPPVPPQIARALDYILRSAPRQK